MTSEQKELYKKVRRKIILNNVRIVQKIFGQHLKSLDKRTVKEQMIIGDFIVGLEMELKKILKNQI